MRAGWCLKGAELVDRLATLVAFLRFSTMDVVDSRSLRSDNYYLHYFVRSTIYVPFRRLWGDV
jgi:hypothetical protein